MKIKKDLPSNRNVWHSLCERLKSGQNAAIQKRFLFWFHNRTAFMPGFHFLRSIKEFTLFYKCICPFPTRNDRLVKISLARILCSYILFSLQSVLNTWNKSNLNQALISQGHVTASNDFTRDQWLTEKRMTQILK